jgi:hypothetical protein
MSLFLLGSEAIGAQERSDHVSGNSQSGGAIDQLQDHGSDPPQARCVEAEDAEGGDPDDDVDEIKHDEPRACAAGCAVQRKYRRGRIKSRRESVSAGVRNL